MALSKILHIAQIALEPTTGMGRIACEWRDAAQRRNIEFVHIGPAEVGPLRHRLLFPPRARKIAEPQITKETLVLIHEPCAWAFRGFGVRKIAFSHGIELRGAEIEPEYRKISFKSKLAHPLFQWLGRRGLQAMDQVMVSNTDDREYLASQSIMNRERIYVFQNGVDPVTTSDREPPPANDAMTVVFNASWVERKGTETLVKAAELLAGRGIRPRWLLIGGGVPIETVFTSWPESLRPDLTVIPEFPRDKETSLIGCGQTFVLPSFFEGQPLALLQAMAAGRTCITSNCCGQKDLIRHRSNGLLFTPGREEELANLVQEVLENPSLREELGRNARASVADRSWSKSTDELMDWLKGTA